MVEIIIVLMYLIIMALLMAFALAFKHEHLSAFDHIRMFLSIVVWPATCIFVLIILACEELKDKIRGQQ